MTHPKITIGKIAINQWIQEYSIPQNCLKYSTPINQWSFLGSGSHNCTSTFSWACLYSPIFSHIQSPKFVCVSSLSLLHSPLVVSCQVAIHPYFGVKLPIFGATTNNCWICELVAGLHRSLSTGLFVSTYGSRKFTG